jgi:GR25 family glycosyltransferase involved in LPS biosynthesis
MNIIDKIYYINLDRRPDRNEHFLKECLNHNIPYEKIQRFKAIDGLTYNFSLKEKTFFKNVDYKNKPFVKNIMGNQLSHYNILLDMIYNNYKYIIIFQDDIILKKNFLIYLENVINNIPDNAEIINIAFHNFAAYNIFIPWNIEQEIEEKKMAKHNINEYICILNNTVNPCSLGYIVTLKGAKNLVSYFKNTGFLRATDCNYNDYLNKKNIFYGSRIVLATGNPKLGSDIFI